MGLPLTGSPNRAESLLHVETDEVVVSINGKPVHPTAEQLKLSDQWNSIAHLSVYPVQAKVHYFQPQSDYNEETGDQSLQDGVFPCFYENQDYQILIQSKRDNLFPTFEHENKSIREAVQPVAHDRKVLMGHLNFRNEVGLTDLVVKAGERVLLKMVIEVFPSKMDYRHDYQRLLADINKITYNLAFDFLRKTYSMASLKSNVKPTPVEFFRLLESLFQNLIHTVDRIERAPHSEMEVMYKKRRLEKVRKASTKNQQWLRKNPHLLRAHKSGIVHVQQHSFMPEYLQDEQKYRSYDTTENRLLKWMLKQISTKLQQFQQQYERLNRRELDERFLGRLIRMNQQLQRLLQKPFLQQVGHMNHMTVTLVMQMAPGYREVYRYFLILRKGLSIQKDVFRMSVKQLSTLYEYWCFLKIHDILSEKYQVVSNQLLKVKADGLWLTLDKSKRGKMIYRNPRNGEMYELVYNPLYRQLTTHQQPDHVLSLKKKGSEVHYKFVFDAKYKVNPALPGSSYQKKYHIAGPEEDINTMHRL